MLLPVTARLFEEIECGSRTESCWQRLNVPLSKVAVFITLSANLMLVSGIWCLCKLLSSSPILGTADAIERLQWFDYGAFIMRLAYSLQFGCMLYVAFAMANVLRSEFRIRCVTASKSLFALLLTTIILVGWVLQRMLWYNDSTTYRLGFVGSETSIWSRDILPVHGELVAASYSVTSR